MTHLSGQSPLGVERGTDHVVRQRGHITTLLDERERRESDDVIKRSLVNYTLLA